MDRLAPAHSPDVELELPESPEDLEELHRNLESHDYALTKGGLRYYLGSVEDFIELEEPEDHSDTMGKYRKLESARSGDEPEVVLVSYEGSIEDLQSFYSEFTSSRSKLI